MIFFVLFAIAFAQTNFTCGPNCLCEYSKETETLTISGNG